MLSRVVRQILQATVYDVAIETPLEAAPRISQKINKPVNPIKKKPFWIRSKLINSQNFFSKWNL